MRLSIIKGLLPWLIFFSFADGTVLGLNMATVTSFACFFVFNFKTFRKHFILDNITFLLLFVFLIGGFFVQSTLLAKYAYLIANSVLALACFIPLFFHEPFSIQYARLTLDPSYNNNRLFQTVNTWISFIWGMVFLLSSISVGLCDFGIGSVLVMVKIIPTALIVFGLGFTILFPDIYRSSFIIKGSVAAIFGISPVKLAKMGSVSIGYRLRGEGPVIILMQDFGINMHFWDPDFIQKLSQRFKVVLFDYPGIGHSTFEQMPYSSEKISDYIHRFLEQINLKPKAIVSFGHGDIIAEKYIELFKEELKGAIFISNNCQSQLINVWSNSNLEADNKIEKIIRLLFSDLVIKRMKSKIDILYESSLLEGKCDEAILKKQKLLIENTNENKIINIPALSITGKGKIENKKSEHVEYEDAALGVIYQYPIEVVKNIEDFLIGKMNAE